MSLLVLRWGRRCCPGALRHRILCNPLGRQPCRRPGLVEVPVPPQGGSCTGCCNIWPRWCARCGWPRWSARCGWPRCCARCGPSWPRRGILLQGRLPATRCLCPLLVAIALVAVPRANIHPRARTSARSPRGAGPPHGVPSPRGPGSPRGAVIRVGMTSPRGPLSDRMSPPPPETASAEAEAAVCEAGASLTLRGRCRSERPANRGGEDRHELLRVVCRRPHCNGRASRRAGRAPRRACHSGTLLQGRLPAARCLLPAAGGTPLEQQVQARCH